MMIFLILNFQQFGDSFENILDLYISKFLYIYQEIYIFLAMRKRRKKRRRKKRQRRKGK